MKSVKKQVAYIDVGLDNELFMLEMKALMFLNLFQLSFSYNELLNFLLNNHSKTSFILGLQLANPHIHRITSKGGFQGEFHPCGHHPSLPTRSKNSNIWKQVWMAWRHKQDPTLPIDFRGSCCVLFSALLKIRALI